MREAKAQPGWLRASRPFVVALMALGIGAALVWPMVRMDPRDIPIAVVNLDAGVPTPLGDLNLGDQVSGTVTGHERDGSDIEAVLAFIQGNQDEVLRSGADAVDEVKDGDIENMVAWVEMGSRAEVDQSLADNEIYAALVVPADFTTSQVMAMLGAGEAAPLTLIVNEGKNPMVTSQLAGSIETLGGTGAVDIVTEYHNEVPDSLGLIASFLPMILMILVYLSSYASAITLRAAIPLTETRRVRTVALQLLLAIGLSALIGFATAQVLAALVDVEFSLLDVGGFQAFAAFALITLVLGSVNWVGTLGMAVPVLILVTGIGTADLPYEFLPSFWQEYIHPWNPLRFIADGGRALAFQGAGWWNPATPGVAAAGAVGVTLMATSVLTPFRRAKEAR